MFQCSFYNHIKAIENAYSKIVFPETKPLYWSSLASFVINKDGNSLFFIASEEIFFLIFLLTLISNFMMTIFKQKYPMSSEVSESINKYVRIEFCLFKEELCLASKMQ